jgi:glycosyltransferase involved in cell wall biosynthesis
MKIGVWSPQVFAINDKLDYGGAERSIYNLCRGLRDLNEDVTLIAPKGSDIEDIEVIETIDPTGEWSNEELKAFEAIDDWMTIYDLDIINDHQHSYTRVEGDIPPILHSLHGKATISPTDGTILVSESEYQKQDMLERYNVDSHVIPASIDTNHYAFCKDKDDYFLFIGVMLEHKGHAIAIDMCRKAGVNLKMAGGTFGANELYVKMIKEFAERSRVTDYLGYVSEKKKVDLLQHAKALIVPFQFHEMFSLLVLEALSCGTPVITTPTNVIHELIDARHGFICKTQGEAITAIENIDIINPKDCRKHVVDNFSMEKVAGQYRDLYKEVINCQK